MVDRGHQEHPLAGALEIQHLNDHRQCLDHEQAADDGQHNLVFGADGNGPERAAKRQRPGIAHEHRRRGGVVPQEPQPPADQRGGEHQNLAGAGHEMDAQIVGEIEVSDHIGNHPEGGRGDHHRHDGQPVQPVGQVDGIGRADDDDHPEGHKEQAHVDQHVLEERHGQRVGQPLRMGQRRGQRRQPGDQQPQQEPHAAGHPLGVLLGHLGIVIGKADQPEGQRHQKHDPDIDGIQPRPEHGRHHQRRQDQKAPHRRRARLDEMGLRPVIADRLALALLAPQKVDQRSSEDETKDQRGKEGRPGAERDVAEQVEDVAAVRELRQPVQHSFHSFGIRGHRLPEFAQGVNDRRHLDAL